jgi:hypothetical protein
MASRDIPRDRWRDELDSFSRQHEGWIVRVEVIGPDGQVRTEARNLPLQGVSADSPHSDRVAIMIGERPDAHVTHEVVKPVAVEIEQTDAGAERGLKIQAADGSTTRVEFRSPIRPEEVDGMPSR